MLFSIHEKEGFSNGQSSLKYTDAHGILSECIPLKCKLISLSSERHKYLGLKGPNIYIISYCFSLVGSQKITL